MSDWTGFALLLTLASACAVNWGYLAEHRAVSKLPPLSASHPLRSVKLLLGNKDWLVGFGMETLGFALYVAALALAPLALVQTVAAGGIGVLALLVSRTASERLDPREQLGVAFAIGGLALLGVSLAGGSGHGSSASWFATGIWLAASAGIAFFAMTSGWLGGGGAAFGLAAGILFAAGDVSTKVAVGGGSHIPIAPAMIFFYGAGTIALQAGFQRGRALTTAGIAVLGTNAIPIVAAMTLFREPVPEGALGAVRVASFAAVVVGAVALAPRRVRGEIGAQAPALAPPHAQPSKASPA